MELQTALEYLPKVIEKGITHPNYKIVVEKALKWFAYYTGEGLSDFLQQVTSTETDEEFKQRETLTKHITPAVLNSTKIPFNKALRKKPEFSTIDYIEGGSTGAVTEINEYLKKFNGTRSLDEYLEFVYVEFNYHDPNAWLIVEFESNDPTRKAQPYPFIATASEAIDYEYINGILNYLIVKLPIKYMDSGKEMDGWKYTLYAGNQTIVMQTVPIDYQLQPGDNALVKIDNNKYSQQVYQVQALQDGNPLDPNLVPAAMRFGYIRHPKKDYYLSIFECSMSYLEKTLKVNSELDQSMAMVAFPQRYSFVPKCSNDGCFKGHLPDGRDCPSCNGTGYATAHSGTQQIIKLPLPDNKEEMIDLNGLLIYKSPPIDILTFDSEYIKQLKIDIHTTIFNVDLISKTEVSTTATEQLLNRDNMNDTLLPFARHYSEVRTMCVFFIAVYTDNVKRLSNGDPNIIIIHKFPYDFKLKTLNELMADLKSAYDSGASVATITAIEDDINDILYFDRPDELKKIRTINRYNPFRGNKPDEVKLLISSGLVSKHDQVLYSNLSNIFQELERENQDPWLYDMEDAKIYPLVEAKIKERQAVLEAEKPKEVARIDFNA